MNDRKTVQVVHFNGREFQRITWVRPKAGVRAVTVVWAVWEHKGPSVMSGKCMGRREI